MDGYDGAAGVADKALEAEDQQRGDQCQSRGVLAVCNHVLDALECFPVLLQRILMMRRALDLPQIRLLSFAQSGCRDRELQDGGVVAGLQYQSMPQRWLKACRELDGGLVAEQAEVVVVGFILEHKPY